MMFDQDLLEKIRTEFPRAETDLNGQRRAFFDNATGTLDVERATRDEAEARLTCSANVGEFLMSQRRQMQLFLREERR